MRTLPERAPLIEQVVQAQRQLVHLLLGAAGPSWAQIDLTMGQLKALATVAESGPLPVGRLGAMLGLGKPATTLLVDALVRRELVVRSEDPDDRRRTLVRLSARGQDLIDELRLGHQSRREELSRWIGQIDDDDLAALARGLRALLAVASAQSQAEPD